jgi:hypothetical protein
MKGTYPNSVFHFTDEFENLIDILKGTFKLSYAKEEIVGPNQSKVFGAPMVSFCDLRLSEIGFVSEKYGPYGIGLKKEWALKKGLNPVWYINPESTLFDNYCTAIESYFKLAIETIGVDELKKYNETIGLWRYMKNYIGTLNRRGKPPIENYLFANEKEWRFVPEINSIFNSIIPAEKIATKEDKIHMNSLIEDIRLPFQADEITYLIIKDESEINALFDQIGLIKAPIYNDDNIVNRLKTRIVTAKQIFDDF